MPHEVIMPALGMAQETGQIVTWLKKPGDAVKAGDALMEVETDKATMEVEAAADGFLTDVRAGEGDSVPVGDVVAMISESADDAGAGSAGAAADGTAEAGSGPTEDATAAPGNPVEGKEVIMPALGMSQDSGKIVAWHKTPGDQVGAEDVLFEVETDKAVTEVQAGHDGWLAETRGAEGEDIPVGEVIAIISADKPETPRKLSHAEASSAAVPPAAATPVEAPDESDAEKTAVPTRREHAPAAPGSAAQRVPRANGAGPASRVLASPKARRLAAERGLDLSRLAEAGYAPPFHVADLETLAAMPRTADASAAGAGAQAAHLAAEVPAGALDAFCAWADGEGVAVTSARAVATFAAGALRGANEAGRSVHVAASRPGQALATFADPDLAPFGDELQETDAAPDIVLRDLTGSRLTALSLGSASAPTLTLTRAGGTIRLALDFDASALDPDAAIALIEAIAGRIDEPLRHLL